MQKAAFSIENYQFDKVNIDLTNHISKELSLSFDTSGVFISQGSLYELTFLVEIFSEGQKLPFASVQCKGIFKLNSISKLEDIPDFFYKNSIAILFPYVRAYISLVTTQANVPSIILPTLNLSSLEGDLRNKTSLK